MSTRIRNITGGAVPLPAPYRGTLPPGAGTILTDSPSTVIANMGGPAAVANVFDIGPTSEMGVAANDLAADVALEVHLDPSGKDTATGRQDDPVQSLEGAAAAAVAAGVPYKRVHLLPAPGRYPDLSLDPNGGRVLSLPGPTGLRASSLAIIAPFTSLLGQLSESAGTATGRTLTVASKPAGLRSTTTASIVAGAPSGMVRIINLIGPYTSADVGSYVKPSGCATAGNNGKLPIQAVNSPTSIDVLNFQGAAGDANNGAITVIDAFNGGYVTFLTGALAGTQVSIRDNTATTFDLMVGAGAVGIGDKFQIERESATFPYTGTFGLAASAASLLGLRGVRFLGTNPGSSTFSTFGPLNICCEGAHIDLGGGGMVMPVLAALRSSDPLAWGNDGADNPFSFSRTAAAPFIQNGFMTVGGDRARLANNFGFGHLSLTIRRSEAVLTNVFGERTTIVATDDSVLDLDADSGSYFGLLNLGLMAGDSPLQVVNGTNSRRLRRTSVSYAGAYGLDMQSAGYINVGNLSFSGTGIADMHCDRQSRGRIDASGSTVAPAGVEFNHETTPNIQTLATIRTPDVNGMKGYPLNADPVRVAYGSHLDA